MDHEEVLIIYRVGILDQPHEMAWLRAGWDQAPPGRMRAFCSTRRASYHFPNRTRSRYHTVSCMEMRTLWARSQASTRTINRSPKAALSSYEVGGEPCPRGYLHEVPLKPGKSPLVHMVVDPCRKGVLIEEMLGIELELGKRDKGLVVVEVSSFPGRALPRHPCNPVPLQDARTVCSETGREYFRLR